MYASIRDVLYMHAHVGKTGQASRIARCCELNRESHLCDDLEPSRQNDAQKLWWTVCVLDQRHLATIGTSPEYLVEEQNDILLSPDTYPSSASSFTLRFNLSVANLLTRVMAGNGTQSLYEQSNIIK